MIKIVLIDDHKMILQGLLTNLSHADNIKIVGAYTEVDDFILCLKNNIVDIVIMDFMLKTHNSFEVIDMMSKYLSSVPKIIILSGFYEELLHKRALELGVKAFLKKESSYDELISTVLNVYHGNTIIPDIFVEPRDHQLLTETELIVLKLLVDEYTNDKIAQELFISRRTVETHVTNICRKLGVNGRIGAVREGIKLNLVD